MFYLALSILLLAAAACLGLSRRVATQKLGFFAAGALVVAATTLLLEQWRGPVFDAPTLIWVALDQMTIYISPELGMVELALALTLLYGGALALVTLALTLVPTVRGFGGLFAWALLTLVAVLVGLAGSNLLLPFAWGLTVLLSYSAVRSSGALNQSTALPQGLALGFLASVLLLGGLLVAGPALSVGEVPPAFAAVSVGLACVMLVGGAPFHGAFEEIVTAPPALGGLMYGLALPILGMGTLLRLAETAQPWLPPFWRVIVLLLGLLSALICAVAALREHSLRRLLGWQASGQAGLVFIAVGLEGPLAALAGPALLVNLALTSLVGVLAVTSLESLTGSDDFTQVTIAVDLRMSGILWALAALSAVGMPLLWGFWGRRWLLEAAIAQAPWSVPLVLMATILALLAYLGPLARFWGQTGTRQGLARSEEESERRAAVQPGDLIVVSLALGPLLVLGVAPQIAWTGWLQAVHDAPAQLPVSVVAQVVGGVVGVLGILLAVMLWWRGWSRRVLPDPDMSPVVLAPDALADSLFFLGWPGHPDQLLRGIWKGIQFLSRGVATVIAPFEQRFYLAAVLLAVISVILLMAQ